MINERSVPLDRSGYFDKGATTTDDLRTAWRRSF
jgi:hypothetical protein